LVAGRVLERGDDAAPRLTLGFLGEDHALVGQFTMGLRYVVHGEGRAGEAADQRLVVIGGVRLDELHHQRHRAGGEHAVAEARAVGDELETEGSGVEVSRCFKVRDEEAGGGELHGSSCGWMMAPGQATFDTRPPRPNASLTR
jgi:hypothetical protein